MEFIKSKHPFRTLRAQLLAAVTVIWLPFSALALSVGPIELQSNLNQALEAQIPLHNFGDLDKTQIKISLAENAFYKRAGLYRAHWLSELDFEVIQNPDDTGFIVLRTETAIKDPVVELLINIAWPTGKMVRQYTLLLDPSDVSAKNNLPLTYQIGAIEPHSIIASSETIKSIDFGQVYGPIQADDSLWKIANKLVADSEFSTSQGVLAIYQKNPEAFANGNMNELRTGVNLNLPQREEVARANAFEAGEIISSSPIPQTDRAKKTNLQRAVNSSSSKKAVSDNKPLKILSPENLSDAKKKSLENFQSENSFTNTNPALDQKLALLEEQLDTLKRQNEVIKQQNSQLAASNSRLQQELQQSVQKTLSQASATESQSLSTDSIHQKVNQQLQNDEMVSDGSLSTEPPPSKKLSMTDNPASSSQPSATATIAAAGINIANESALALTGKSNTQLLSWLLSLLGAAGLFSLGGYWLYNNRQRWVRDGRDTTTSEKKQKQSGKLKKLMDTGVDNYGLDFDMEKVLSSVEIGNAEDATTNHKEHLNAQLDYEAVKRKFQHQIDEAELLLAYEKYDDAEKQLIGILDEAPNHWLAHLKLLELYVIRNQNASFHTWFDKLPAQLNHIVPEIWAKINFLREKIEQDELYPSNQTSVIETVEQSASSAVASDEVNIETQALAKRDDDDDSNEFLSFGEAIDETSNDTTNFETAAKSEKPQLSDDAYLEDFSEQQDFTHEVPVEAVEEFGESSNPLSFEFDTVKEDGAEKISDTLEQGTVESDAVSLSEGVDKDAPLEFVLKDTIEKPAKQSDSFKEDTAAESGTHTLEFTLDEDIKNFHEHHHDLSQGTMSVDASEEYTDEMADEDHGSVTLSFESKHLHDDGDDYEETHVLPPLPSDGEAKSSDFLNNSFDVDATESAAESDESLDDFFSQGVHQHEAASAEHSSPEMCLEASTSADDALDMPASIDGEGFAAQEATDTQWDDAKALESAVDSDAIEIEATELPSGDDHSHEMSIDLSQNLNQIEHLSALLDGSPSLELAKAFILAGEHKSAKSLLKQIMGQTSDLKQKQIIQSILEQF